MRTLRNAPKHPRAVREQAKGEVVILITGEDALRRLTADCRFPEAKARRLLNIAWEFGQKAEPCPGGYVHIWYHGIDDTDTHIFSVVEHIGPDAKKGLAKPAEKGYTQRKQTKASGASRDTKGTTMPPRGRKPNPKPDPEPEQNGEVDLAKYLTRDLTATMQDYVEWFEENVAPLADLRRDLPRILYLGVTLYSHFQKSDFNVERREERRAERASAREPEPEPASARRGRGKPAAANGTSARGTRGRTAAKPAAAAKPATRGRGKPAAAKPAATSGRGTRGRGTRTAAAAASGKGTDAPF
jgi:hypothetical protein